MRKCRKFVVAGSMVALTAVLSACGAKTKNTKSSSILDPDNPVSLTVWHYYNVAQQAAFDELVSEFNGTTGKDLGIYVEGYSQGSVSDLEKAVSDAVNGTVGAEPLFYLCGYSICCSAKRHANLRFVCESAYLPVRKEANSMDALDEVIKQQELQGRMRWHLT